MTLLRPTSEQFPPLPQSTNPDTIEQARRYILATTEQTRTGEKRLSRTNQRRLAEIAIATLDNPDLPAFEAVTTASQILAELPDRYQTQMLYDTLSQIIQSRAQEAYPGNATQELAATRLAIQGTDREHSFPEALENARHQLGQPSTEDIIRKSSSLITHHDLGATAPQEVVEPRHKPS